jgi:Flp pilus assembly pilin Flp
MRRLRLFLNDEQGVVPTEYVIMVAAIGVLLAAGIVVLLQAMSGLFAAWARYFAGGS